MKPWRALTYGLRSLLRRSRQQANVAAELDQFYADAAADWQRKGLSPDDARRAARREAGSITAARDQANSYGWEISLLSLTRDLRFAARQLWKHPLFAVTATLTLALGIGANAAIFTVIQSVLIAPLPYRHAERLAIVETHWTDSGKTTMRVTGPDAVDLRDQAHSLEAISLYSGGTIGVELRNHSVYTEFAEVDPNFARVFSLEPIAGRLFTASESHRAALVSESFARENYGAAQAALGQVLHIENQPLEITGVLPAGFAFPGETQVWEASPLQPESKVRSAFNYKAVARLRQDATFGSATAELDEISARLRTAYLDDNRNKQLGLQPLQQALTGEARPTLLFLWATVALILLIACVNVTHLQLVRSMERRRELAIRRAIGSSRWQVVRPVLIEGLLLALIGGIAGVLLAFPAVRILVAMAPKELPRAGEIHLNGWVLAFTLILSVVAALASSFLPSLRAASVDPAEALKHNASRGMQRHGATGLRNSLVVAEIAATFVLSMGAALLLHTMMSLSARDMGYQPRQLLVVDADLPARTAEDAQRGIAQFNQIFAQLTAIPGVANAAGIMGLPTSDYGSNGYYETKGGLPALSDRKPYSLFSVASPGYFQTMSIPLKRGRDFTPGDTAESPLVAIISESLARQSFGDADPIGRPIRCGLDTDKWMTIVGVVGDVRQASPAEKPGPNLYMPMAQHPFYANQIHIVLRTRVGPVSLISFVQQKIVETNPMIAMRFTTMDEMLNRSVATERFRAVLISSFAGIGLVLAMLGVYGTMAYSVTQHTFEIGICMAFGAERSGILRNVLGKAARLAAFGIGLGLALSLILTRLVTSMLEGVHPADPLSIVFAAALLLVTALAAGFGPGWRATRVNPMVALRSE